MTATDDPRVVVLDVATPADLLDPANYDEDARRIYGECARPVAGTPVFVWHCTLPYRHPGDCEVRDHITGALIYGPAV